MIKTQNIEVTIRTSDNHMVPGVVYSKGYNKSISICKKFFKQLDRDIMYTVLNNKARSFRGGFSRVGMGSR